MMGQGTNRDTGTCDTCPLLGRCRWSDFPLLLGPPVAGERERPIVTSQLEQGGAIQYLLSNTNELANTSAADEEVHLDAIKPSE